MLNLENDHGTRGWHDKAEPSGKSGPFCQKMKFQG